MSAERASRARSCAPVSFGVVAGAAPLPAAWAVSAPFGASFSSIWVSSLEFRACALTNSQGKPCEGLGFFGSAPSAPRVAAPASAGTVTKLSSIGVQLTAR